MFTAIDSHRVAAAARRTWPADVPEDDRHLFERAARKDEGEAGDVGMFWPSEASPAAEVRRRAFYFKLAPQASDFIVGGALAARQFPVGKPPMLLGFFPPSKNRLKPRRRQDSTTVEQQQRRRKKKRDIIWLSRGARFDMDQPSIGFFSLTNWPPVSHFTPFRKLSV
ncbi:hypothetical protein TEQG_05207 [Trichophyton equinum CBS 127.97]|uniref:Uncharacterized protein n=1 Tax=Trichophyton equinum (strain ATCC MYA-4606 / CBS 127.97) TaxID=559882 RepID=F2PW26_TRIEC|nr:hypothetical protein TEQG_05207 [Trichophyton equinum CBS 127.97]